MKFAVYSRKSKATDKGESIENQISFCKDQVMRQFSSTTDDDFDIFIDDGFSAKDTNRPKFQTMMSLVATKKYDYVVCYRLDRISRNICDFTSIVEFLNKHGASFISVKENFDTSTPTGRMMMYITSIFAQMERETIAERVRDNMLLLSKTGRWLGGKTPLGFDSERRTYTEIDGTKKHYSALVNNPEECHIIRLMFDKYLELGSLIAVSQYMAASNIRSRSGNLLSDQVIKSCLMNPVYCAADQEAYDYFTSVGVDMVNTRDQYDGSHGLLPYNRHNNSHGSVTQRAFSEWVIAIAPHEGLVSGEQFARVQKKLNDNKMKYQGFTTATNSYAMLSGIVYCKKCGSRMYCKRQNPGGRTKSADSYFYICEKKKKYASRLCDCRDLLGNKADDLIVQELFNYAKPDSPIHRQLEALRDVQARRKKAVSAIAVYRTQLEAKKKAIEKLVMTLATEELSSASTSYVDAQIKVLDQEVKALQEQILSEEANIENSDMAVNQVEQISGFINSFIRNFDHMTIEEKRNLIKLILDRVEWDGNELHIFILGNR